MKYVFIGDPHVTPDSIPECERLMALIQGQYPWPKKGEPTKLVFLGDLYHTHASIRVEVLDFWNKWLGYFGEILGKENVIALVGNHDKPGNAAAPPNMHALLAHRNIVTIVDQPVVLDGIAYMPYMNSPEEFVAAAKELKSDVLVCHQTFIGANYENNFPAPDGVDINQVPHKLIISGHIHMRQEIDTDRNKMIYPGAPRWMTVSDANQEKGIMIAELQVPAGRLEQFSYSYLTTYGMCKMIRAIEINSGNIDKLLYLKLRDDERFIVTVKGTRSWVKERIDAVVGFTQGHDVSLKTVYTDEENATAVKESEGLAVSLKKYIHSKEWGIPKEQLWAEVTNRISWLAMKQS